LGSEGSDVRVYAAIVLGGSILFAAPRAAGQNVRPTTPFDARHFDPHDPRERPQEGPVEERPAEERPTELFPRAPMARAAGWMLAPEPAPSDREAQAEERLERYFDDVLNEDRMQAVGANGWYSEMQRAMRRAFDPNMREVERERRAPMNALGRLVDELRRYANGPEPPQDNRGAPPPEVWNDHHDDVTQAALEMQDQMNLLNAPVTWYRVDIRVTQNPEGVVSAAWVIRSSGYTALDDAALRAVREGTVTLPPPPDRVVGTEQAIRSDWAFEAGDVATYWTTAGCVDDPVDGGYQCAAGGRGIVRTRIRLLRVVDAEHESFEARRLRRRGRPPILHP
jgi:TonB family protein